MKRIEIQGYDTVVCLKEGRIEDEDVDVLINWVNPDLKSGPRSFYNIHKKAGPVLFNYTLGFEEIAHETDAFSTSSALLDCKVVVHAVIPQVKNGYLKAFFNIAETIKKYKEENLTRSVSLYIPEQADLCLAGVYSFLLDLGLKEVNILYLTDNELKRIESFFKKYEKKYTIWSRVDKAIVSGMTKLYEKSSRAFRNYKLTRKIANLLTPYEKAD